jgi:hypothetical protein
LQHVFRVADAPGGAFVVVDETPYSSTIASGQKRARTATNLRSADLVDGPAAEDTFARRPRHSAVMELKAATVDLLNKEQQAQCQYALTN